MSLINNTTQSIESAVGSVILTGITTFGISSENPTDHNNNENDIPNRSNYNSGISTTTIVIITVICAIIFFVFIIGAIWIMYRRRKKRSDKRDFRMNRRRSAKVFPVKMSRGIISNVKKFAVTTHPIDRDDDSDSDNDEDEEKQEIYEEKKSAGIESVQW